MRRIRNYLTEVSGWLADREAIPNSKTVVRTSIPVGVAHFRCSDRCHFPNRRGEKRHRFAVEDDSCRAAMNNLQTQASTPKKNPKIEARLNEYIEAHRSDLAFYSRLVSEDPTRAVRMLMLRDMQLFAVTMKRVAERLPRAKALYEAQPPTVRGQIDNAIAFVNPYHRDQAFVNEVFRTLGVIEYQPAGTP